MYNLLRTSRYFINEVCDVTTSETSAKMLMFVNSLAIFLARDWSIFIILFPLYDLSWILLISSSHNALIYDLKYGMASLSSIECDSCHPPFTIHKVYSFTATFDLLGFNFTPKKAVLKISPR